MRIPTWCRVYGVGYMVCSSKGLILIHQMFSSKCVDGTHAIDREPKDHINVRILRAPPNYFLRHPKYQFIETYRDRKALNCGTLGGLGSNHGFWIPILSWALDPESRVRILCRPSGPHSGLLFGALIFTHRTLGMINGSSNSNVSRDDYD